SGKLLDMSLGGPPRRCGTAHFAKCAASSAHSHRYASAKVKAPASWSSAPDQNPAWLPPCRWHGTLCKVCRILGALPPLCFTKVKAPSSWSTAPDQSPTWLPPCRCGRHTLQSVPHPRRGGGTTKLVERSKSLEAS